MPDSTKRPAAEDTSPVRPCLPVSPAAQRAGGPEVVSEAQPCNPATGAVTKGPGPKEDPTVALKRRLEETRLPADLKEQILAELPPAEERERLFRELQGQ